MMIFSSSKETSRISLKNKNFVYDINFLPNFPEFRELRIEDQYLLQRYFDQLYPQTSMHNFTNLFIWRHCYHTRISKWHQNILILAYTAHEGEFFLEPLGQDKILETIQLCLSFLKERNNTVKPTIRRVSERFIKTYLNNQYEFSIERDIDRAEYVYLTKDLIHLKGRRYHGQRNHIKRFKETYPNFKIEIINYKNISECLELSQQWLLKKYEDLNNKNLKPEEVFQIKSFLDEEAVAVKEVLLHFHQLLVVGLAIRIDGKIRAFSIGEKLNPETALIHIEKADHRYRGLAQFICQVFTQIAWSDCKFVNREEDLGLEGLRKAKLALGPNHFVYKYNVSWKQYL